MTRAGRPPACSWPACGLNSNQTTSPRSGMYPRATYQTSRPRGRPEMTSSCRFRSLIPLSRSLSEYFLGRAGRTIRPPRTREMSTTEPGSTLASAAKDLGMRRPRLLPHFWTLVSIHPLVSTHCISREDGGQGRSTSWPSVTLRAPGGTRMAVHFRAERTAREDIAHADLDQDQDLRRVHRGLGSRGRDGGQG